MAQQILRTEDIIECLDDRIYTETPHIPIGVAEGEVYSSVLTKIENQVCSPQEKLALVLTLTAPSASNPIVLKDDLSTYYPADDLGSLRDAVNNLVDLPTTGNYLNDLRPVLSVMAIYRWDGGSWLPFISTGTVDHTQLSSLNTDTNYLHVPASSLASLVSQSHTHSNKLVLDAILSLGSGIVISSAERSRLPSIEEKEALDYATSPSATNRFVTSLDPRLNTVKNPYVTFGPTLSETTYMGDTIVELRAALAHLSSSGDVEFINALEILPATYSPDTIDYLGIDWSDSKPLLLEGLASRQAVLQIAPQPAGSTAFHIGDGEGRVTIRGLTFEIAGTANIGMVIDRDDTIIEDCTFKAITSGIFGVRILAANVNIRRCVFQGDMDVGIEVIGENCHIENCRIDISSSSAKAIDISSHGCMISSCAISSGIININALAQDTTFDKTRLTPNTSFIDVGVNTRWLGSVPQDYQQAYIGRTRSVGPINSFADFRGSNETPFLAALSDPYTTEVEVFDGSYSFTSPVFVPRGKSVKSITPNFSVISGEHCFILDSYSSLFGLNISTTNVDGITAVVGASKVEINRCSINTNSCAIKAVDTLDFSVTGCRLSGTQGISLLGDLRSRITRNVFSSAISVMSSTSTLHLHYADNTEEGSVPQLYGDRALVKGNLFMGAVPTKVHTYQSLWLGNFPVEANNTNGIDTIKLNTSDLHPIEGSGASYATAIGTQVIALTETGTPTVVTPPIKIGAKINRSLGYQVVLSWTSPLFSGNVNWEVSVVFRDRTTVSDIGSPTVVTAIAPRTQYTVRGEEMTTVTFTNLDFGYILGVDLTHVSLVVRRLGDTVNDSLGGVVYLTEASIIFARD